MKTFQANAKSESAFLIRHRSLLRGWEGLVQIGGGSMIFMREKAGAYKLINVHTLILGGLRG